MQDLTYSPLRSRRRASDTLIAPTSYRPLLEDYDPLRRKSDTLELPPTIAEELRGSRNSLCSSIGSHGSGDTLILPAITVPRVGGEDTKSGESTNRKPRTISLPAVTVTADPESTFDQHRASSFTHRPSFYAPASKVKYALMVRGRRSSSACVASTVFEHPLVSLLEQVFFLLCCFTKKQSFYSCKSGILDACKQEGTWCSLCPSIGILMSQVSTCKMSLSGKCSLKTQLFWR